MLLSVNDKEIAKKDYPQYYPVIDAIEQGLEKSKANAIKAQEHQNKLLLHKQELMQQHQASLQHKQEALQKHLSNLDLKKQAYHADSLARLNNLKEIEQAKQLHMQQLHDYNEQKKLNHNQNLHINNEKKKLNLHKTRLHSDPVLAAIIADLLTNKLAENETQLSFTLTATELVVNGKTIDSAIFETFKKKYIKSSGDSYSYERNGNSTRTNINIQ